MHWVAERQLRFRLTLGGERCHRPIAVTYHCRRAMAVRSALSAERPCGTFACKLRRLPTIRERSNVHAANIRTLRRSMTILVRQPQNSDRESALCDRHFFTRKSASARNASLDNGQKRTPRSSVLMNSSLARRVPLRQSGRLIQ